MTKRFTARPLDKIENRPGCWNSVRVGVLDGDAQIGEYVRNYPSYAAETFYAFEANGRWLAVYSPDYTCTRLLSLPDCTDIGGEEGDAAGFCPTGYYVPTLTLREPPESADDPQPRVANHDSARWATIVGRRYYWPDDPDHPEPDGARRAAYLAEKERSHAAADAWHERHPFATRYAPFGFVSGCVWGDDSSWKIQHLDLSRAGDGVVTRSDRFGYIWLPSRVGIESAIRMIGNKRVEIAQPVEFDMATGERIVEKDEDGGDE